MKSLRSIVLLSFLISFAFDGKAAEFASWEHKTPSGNIIRNEKSSGYSIVIKCKESYAGTHGFALKNLSKWYFHKNFIIGSNNERANKSYFIFDENECKSLLFKDKSAFERQLKKKQLEPIIWTRWYATDWGFFSMETVLVKLYHFFFTNFHF